jgi:uncharacterized protein DUF429
MVRMITVGVDFASLPKRTALCVIEWTGTEAIVRSYCLNVSDSDIESYVNVADKIGMDVPFGWPQAFTNAVVSHLQRQLWPVASGHELRRTDLHVQQATTRWPLSVSSDRIACTAFRAAAFLSRMEQIHGRIDRTGTGVFVEVYPRAARDRWGCANFGAFSAATGGWLRFAGSTEETCSKSPDCFDAFVAALVARAAAMKLCDPVPEIDLDAAGAEGWIALPREGSLRRLLSPDQLPAVD